MATSLETLGSRVSAAEFLFEKALLALKQREYDKALDFLANCIKADPDHAEAWMIRGNIEHAQGRVFNALLHHDRAVVLDPNKYDAWCNRGIAFADLGLFSSARECYEKSLAIVDAYEPRMNMAAMYCHLMELENAEAQYRAALAGRPLDYEGAIQLGLCLLGQGRWKEGFEHYQVRLLNSPHPVREVKLAPPWLGEDLADKVILLYPEQGLGDEVLFQRFALVLRDRWAARVILEARPPLYRLAKNMAVDRVIVHHDDLPFPVDYQCALTDVAMRLGIEPGTMPYADRYLKIPREWLRLPETSFNVGLCWSTGRRPLQPEVEASWKTKSVPLEWLEPLRQAGVQLYSLQKRHWDDPRLMAKLWIVDMMDGVNDFYDTAALIAGLDLVISVDTAVAHVAGAMGVPVWNLVRFSGYWPWMRETGRTAWYESMRLYRQPALGDWDTPIKQMAEDLRELASRKTRPRPA